MVPSEPKCEWRKGWIIVLSASVCYGLIIGLGRVTGIIFTLVVDNLSVTRTQASCIILAKRLLEFLSAPLVSYLVGHCTYSVLICGGGLIVSFGLFLSSFASELWELSVSFGLIIAIGNTCVISTIILALGKHFNKKRPQAFSIYFTLSSALAFAIPPIFDILVQNFGLKGTFLIYSALTLNIIPCGLLIRQPNDAPYLGNENLRKKQPEVEGEEAEVERFLATDEINSPARPKSRPRRIIASLCNRVDIFRNRAFLLLFFSRVLTMMTVLNLMQFIPDYISKNVQDGVNLTDVSFMISIMTIGDISARLSSGTAFNKLPCHLKYIYATFAVVSGAISVVFPFARSRVPLYICHLIAGFSLGMCTVLPHVIESDLMGPQYTATSHGITQFATGPAGIFMMFAVGYLRDVTGSYTIGLCLLGGSGILGGSIWFLNLLPSPCKKSRQTSV